VNGIHSFEPEAASLPGLGLTAEELSRAVAEEARQLGFARVGICSAAPLELGRARLELFRERGYGGALQYLTVGDRHDPRALHDTAESAIVVLLAHGRSDRVALRKKSGELVGQVARYARGEDYHLVLKQKLFALAGRLATLCGRRVRARPCVDTAPLLERDLAVRAGLGFQGKSTMLIAPGVGTYALLGELLVDVALAPTDARFSGCGSCTACLTACPTAAFPAPYQLDARRCISYFTIEQDGPIPRELRRAMGTRVFGCDVCQEVCPFNASPKIPEGSELGHRDELAAPDLVGLLHLGSAAYRKLVERSALRRVRRTRLQRNAAVALGNTQRSEAVPPLTRALDEHSSALVRAHVAWALGELAEHCDAHATESLERASHDADALVREEAELALERVRRVKNERQCSSSGGASAF
jgi:epoxyqueuosine reductase